MANYYHLGCQWGGYKPFFPILKKKKIVFWNADTLSIDDVVLLSPTGGFKHDAMVIITNSPQSIGDRDDVEDFEGYSEGDRIIDEWYCYEVEWFDYEFEIPFRQSTFQPINNTPTYPNLIQDITKIITNYMVAKKMENLKILLTKNKNLILTGAPGVGKTYKTAEIAIALCDGANKLPPNRSDLMKRYKELVANGQIVFTTFHQSLDYEEFVEGLKPSCDDEETVKYRVESGVFKELCQQALEKESMRSLDDVIDKLKDICSDGNTVDATTVTNAQFSISYNGGNSFYIIPANSSPSAKDPRIPVNIESMKKIYELSHQYNLNKHPYHIQKDYPKIHYPGYAVGILNYLKKEYKVPDYNTDTSEKNYVLIIDEINRGNISKIFGELITLLEKDKRLGEENQITVTLPYSQEKFGVPSNLYIIGTMNTADRSIGAIDYALRRRFTFVSLEADKNVISNYEKYQEDTKENAEKLFDNIKEFIEKNINEDLKAEDLMVGHSYFLCNKKEDLKQRLEYEIIPLLWEYQKDGILMCEREVMKEFVKTLII